jgi:hypothetical protein
MSVVRFSQQQGLHHLSYYRDGLFCGWFSEIGFHYKELSRSAKFHKLKLYHTDLGKPGSEICSTC